MLVTVSQKCTSQNRVLTVLRCGGIFNVPWIQIYCLSPNWKYSENWPAFGKQEYSPSCGQWCSFCIILYTRVMIGLTNMGSQLRRIHFATVCRTVSEEIANRCISQLSMTTPINTDISLHFNDSSTNDDSLPCFAIIFGLLMRSSPFWMISADTGAAAMTRRRRDERS